MSDDELSSLDRIRSLLPLTVTSVEIADPNVTLSGGDWGLGVACPWYLDRSEGDVDWESDEDVIVETFSNFAGQYITAVSAVDSDATDPVFTFSAGARLRVVADSDLDPWVMILPGITLVGRRRRG